MDTKVVNRSVDGPNVWKDVPRVTRLFARDLSDKSYGNAIGIGFADVVTDRLINAVDYNATWVNGLTSSTTQPCATPMHFATDQDCVEKILPTCGCLDPNDCTIVWFPNTMDIAECLVSENLLPEIEQNPEIEIISGPQEIDFDSAGNLIPAFEAVAH